MDKKPKKCHENHLKMKMPYDSYSSLLSSKKSVGRAFDKFFAILGVVGSSPGPDGPFMDLFRTSDGDPRRPWDL